MSKTFQSNNKLLIKVINDLSDFLPYLVIVGGWVPYIYAKYVWKNVPNMAVMTGDIDFGVGVRDFKGKDTVSSRVRKLGYGERHVSMDRLFPFVPIVKDAKGNVKAEVEFITDPKIPKERVDKIIGTKIKVNKIKHFTLLLGSVATVRMEDKKVQVPTEAMFTFNKLLTFIDRKNMQKQRKDLYYVYYMLRFSPQRVQLAGDVAELIKKLRGGKKVKQNLMKYFKSADAKGPLYVEQENGPDAFIDDVRQDVFDKLSGIRRSLE